MTAEELAALSSGSVVTDGVRCYLKLLPSGHHRVSGFYYVDIANGEIIHCGWFAADNVCQSSLACASDIIRSNIDYEQAQEDYWTETHR